MSINTNNLAERQEIDLLEQSLHAFLQGKLDTERFTAARLQMGLYGQRQEGVNMLRVKIPGGRIAPAQFEALADVAETYSQVQHANITTRQSIQIHYVPLARAPEAMRRLAEAGLTTREACSNTIRNMTACGLAGVCPREHVDVGTHLDGATLHFLRNPLTQQMPRKFKISFSGCEADCAQSLLHDAGVIAVNKDGRHGFVLKAAGGLGHKPHEAIMVDEFVPESDLLFALEALLTLHNKYSDRTKRAKSRIKFLVERFGAEGFREKYREEFARTKAALAGRPYPKGAWRAQTGRDIPGPGAPRRLFAQHQAGRFVLPVSVPLGELNGVQLRGIAALLKEHGLEEAHTTQDQNLAIMHVPEVKLEALRAGLAEIGLHEPKSGDNVVSCPGSSTCRLGITSSTIVAPKLSGGLRDLSIRVSGCQNGCAQPETGDIGIYGEGRRMHGKLVPHYQTYFGGSGMSGGGLGIKGPSVPAARIKPALERVQQAYAESGEQGFALWVRKQESDYFKNLLADIIAVKEYEVNDVMRDHGAAADFRVLNFGGGECAGASQVQIGANFFEAAHEREYRRALIFQRKYAEAAQCSEAILRLLGGGLLQLLGGRRQDDLGQIAAQLVQHGLDSIAGELTRLTEQIAGLDEPGEEELAPINRAVDAWTIEVAKFCVTKDEQLDLDEALPEGVAI
jgi:sulfite reductase (ferredoxin)